MGVLSPQKTPPLSSIMEQAMTKKNQQSFTHTYTHTALRTPIKQLLCPILVQLFTPSSGHSQPKLLTDRQMYSRNSRFGKTKKLISVHLPNIDVFDPYQSTSLELRGLHATHYTHICRFSPDPWNDRVEPTVSSTPPYHERQ